MLGEIQIFTWKSKSTQKREQAEYEQWAFPYGQKQRDSLTALLKKTLPRESEAAALITFLTCRELFEGMQRTSESHDEAVDRMINEQKRYKSIIKKKEMTIYLALVLVNEKVGEDCEYPSADEVRAVAAELEQLRRRAR